MLLSSKRAGVLGSLLLGFPHLVLASPEAPRPPSGSAWTSAAGAGSLPGSVQEHNPHGVIVSKIHMVVSSHFDAGCKTAGCGVTRPGDPKVCARVIPNLPKHPGGMGEPWAYQIVNRCKYP